MRFDIRADVRAVRTALDGMERGAARAIVRASNSAIRRARTVAVRDIAKELGVQQKRVRNVMSMQLASNQRFVASLRPEDGRRIAVVDLAARQTKKGVSFRGPAGTARMTVPGAFLATMPSGHMGAFKRLGSPRVMRSGRYKGRSRQPIVELFGPSIPWVFVRDKIINAIDSGAQAEFKKEVWRQVDLLRTQQGL